MVHDCVCCAGSVAMYVQSQDDNAEDEVLEDASNKLFKYRLLAPGTFTGCEHSDPSIRPQSGLGSHVILVKRGVQFQISRLTLTEITCNYTVLAPKGLG